MKLVRFISLAHLPYYFIKLGERPSVNLQHFIIRHSVTGRIKPMKIAERKARGVAQFAITVSDSLEDFLRAAHVLEIIRRRAPEPDDFRARLLDDFFGSDRVTGRLMHRSALRVQRPAVRQDDVVRRAIANG